MRIKPIIYQMLPRLFANNNADCVPNGTIGQNGSGKMNDINLTTLRAIKDLGVTHVWYTGVIEHAHDADYSAYGIARHNPHVIKGKAGSPYAITDYYDIDPDIAVDVDHRLDEFDALVKRTHAAGMKVIIDFVPNHVGRQYHSDMKPAGIKDFGEDDDTTMFFSPRNDFYYITRQQFSPSIDLGQGDDAYVEFPAKASGNDCFNAFPGKYDWYETVKLNYGIDYGDHSHHFDPIPPVWFKMLHILRYWASRGVDGFRCDMAHMVPIEFWRWAIANVKERFPDIIFIAEIYDIHLYRDFLGIGGFDYLYDKVNLYDTLRGVQCHNVSAANITSCWQTVEGISDKMLNFQENHDEQRFASPQYAGDARAIFPSMIVSSMISTGPYMIYMGQELGEKALESEGYSGHDGRTTIFDYWSLSTLRRWRNKGKCDGRMLADEELQLRDEYRRILRLCNNEKAISMGRFFDVMYVNYNNPRFNPHRHYAFLRSYGDVTLLIAVNFGHSPAEIEINLPQHAFDLLDMPQGKAKATELLSGITTEKTLASDTPFKAYLAAPFNAVVWKIEHKDVEPRIRKREQESSEIK